MQCLKTCTNIQQALIKYMSNNIYLCWDWLEFTNDYLPGLGQSFICIALNSLKQKPNAIAISGFIGEKFPSPPFNAEKNWSIIQVNMISVGLKTPQNETLADMMTKKVKLRKELKVNELNCFIYSARAIKNCFIF